MHRSIASTAAVNGPNGPSFEASFTTRSSPSSRCTSSTGFPGWYGVSALTLGRKNASPKSLMRLTLPTRPRGARSRRVFADAWRRGGGDLRAAARAQPGARVPAQRAAGRILAHGRGRRRTGRVARGGGAPRAPRGDGPRGDALAAPHELRLRARRGARPPPLALRAGRRERPRRVLPRRRARRLGAATRLGARRLPLVRPRRG